MRHYYTKAAGRYALELTADPDEMPELLSELELNGFAFVVDDYKVTVFYQGAQGLRKLRELHKTKPQSHD